MAQPNDEGNLDVDNTEEFLERLMTMRADSRLTWREIEKRANAKPENPRTLRLLPKSTISGAFRDGRLPTWEQTQALILVCEGDLRLEAWRRAYRRCRSVTGRWISAADTPEDLPGWARHTPVRLPGPDVQHLAAWLSALPYMATGRALDEMPAQDAAAVLATMETTCAVRRLSATERAAELISEMDEDRAALILTKMDPEAAAFTIESMDQWRASAVLYQMSVEAVVSVMSVMDVHWAANVVTVTHDRRAANILAHESDARVGAILERINPVAAWWVLEGLRDRRTAIVENMSDAFVVTLLDTLSVASAMDILRPMAPDRAKALMGRLSDQLRTDLRQRLPDKRIPPDRSARRHLDA